jgi:hypothetical protein
LWNPDFPLNFIHLKATEDAARTLGVTLLAFEGRSGSDFENAFVRMRRERVGGVVVLGDGVTYSHRGLISDRGTQGYHRSLNLGFTGK